MLVAFTAHKWAAATIAFVLSGREESGVAEAALSSKAGDVRSAGASGWRRTVRWLYVVAASLVVFGVFLQAFSIAAYVRGAGTSARDLHVNGGFLTHNIEIAVFVLALVGFWGAWRLVALALLLPLVGTAQVLLIGDTDNTGGWVNGLHGLFAIVVLVLAVALVELGRRSLRATVTTPAR
jgi:hypothetical protein